MIPRAYGTLPPLTAQVWKENRIQGVKCASFVALFYPLTIVIVASGVRIISVLLRSRKFRLSIRIMTSNNTKTEQAGGCDGERPAS